MACIEVTFDDRVVICGRIVVRASSSCVPNKRRMVSCHFEGTLNQHNPVKNSNGEKFFFLNMSCLLDHLSHIRSIVKFEM